MTVRVEPASVAGRASIHVAGAAGAAERPCFGIQRNEDWDEDKLGPDGWQTSKAALMPDKAEAVGGDLVLHVGWSVCRHLEADMYTLRLPAAGLDGAPMQWPEIQPEHAGSRSVFSPAPPPAAAPVVVPAAASLSPPPPPAPSVVTPSPSVSAGPSRVPLLIGALVMLAIVGAGVAVWQPWKTTMPSEQAAVTQPEPPVPTPPTTLTPPAAPPQSLGDLSVPDVLAKAPNPAAITAEGQRRLAGNRHDDGLLLLEAAADRGDGSASAALGKLYDPVGFQPNGPIPRPDPRQAARYYRDAARAGADVSAARDALKQRLERESAGGNLGAGLTLKDFWP